MSSRLVLLMALLCCCVNQILAESASKLSASTSVQQHESIRTHQTEFQAQAVRTGGEIAAISSTSPETFQPGARKLLVSTVTTSRRRLLQVPVIRNWWGTGRNVGSDGSGGSSWWTALRSGQQRTKPPEEREYVSRLLSTDGTAAPPEDYTAGQSQQLSSSQEQPQQPEPVTTTTAPADSAVTSATPESPSDASTNTASATNAAAPPPAAANPSMPSEPAAAVAVPTASAASAPAETDQVASSPEAEATARAMDFDSWSTLTPCTYAKTLTNFNPDRLGRPWGFNGETKQSCPFRSADAPIILWEEAADCPYKLTDSNSLPDKEGRLWGYDASTGFSCAFKTQTLPAANYENAPATGDYYQAFLHSIQNPGLRAAVTLLLSSAAAAEEQGLSATPASYTTLQQQETGPYCIPVDDQFQVLCAGDSITQGSVPSRGFNYPYAIKLEELLRRKFGPRSRAYDAGLGGGGLYQFGFSINQKFPEFYRENLALRNYDLAIIMIGINDLLRGSSPADDIMAGLQPLFDETLAKGIPIISIPPLPAPGFVAETDPKEAERKKMAELLKAAAARRASETGGVGPQIWVLDLQSGPMDFYKMSNEDRAMWLDDGLHLTQYAYEQLGQFVYDEVMTHMCSIPTLTAKDYAYIAAQEASYSMYRDAARQRA